MTDILFRGALAACVVWLVFMLGQVYDLQQDTLRLLRRGDKVDCSQSEMRGSQP